MLMSWALFLVSAVVIVVAGTKLARYADQIAELNGLGRLWIGVVLVAGATSRPPSFSELPKWFFSSLPGAAVGHAAVSISSSNRCQECGVLPPYRLPTVAKCPPRLTVSMPSGVKHQEVSSRWVAASKALLLLPLNCA